MSRALSRLRLVIDRRIDVERGIRVNRLPVDAARLSREAVAGDLCRLQRQPIGCADRAALQRRLRADRRIMYLAARGQPITNVGLLDLTPLL